MIFSWAEIVTPVPVRAGWLGQGEDREPIYFDCAWCRAIAPPIGGAFCHVGAGERFTFESVAIVPVEPRPGRGMIPDGARDLALYCVGCAARVVSGEFPPGIRKPQ